MPRRSDHCQPALAAAILQHPGPHASAAADKLLSGSHRDAAILCRRPTVVQPRPARTTATGDHSDGGTVAAPVHAARGVAHPAVSDQPLVVLTVTIGVDVVGVHTVVSFGGNAADGPIGGRRRVVRVPVVEQVGNAAVDQALGLVRRRRRMPGPALLLLRAPPAPVVHAARAPHARRPSQAVHALLDIAHRRQVELRHDALELGKPDLLRRQTRRNRCSVAASAVRRHRLLKPAADPAVGRAAPPPHWLRLLLLLRLLLHVHNVRVERRRHQVGAGAARVRVV
mmetsp:Transcript_6471/g.16545  ORF Transcript_6471/g.16545 Transcript_6471/m.16545 type:complete len:283 (-) Transcript_6471:451-1299(-)